MDLFLIDKILAFPFDLFSIAFENIFFPRVVQTLFQSAVLQVTKLASDTGGDSRTLMTFKNQVLTWLNDEYQADFRASLRSARFNARTRELLGNAKELRDSRIAHHLHRNPPAFESGDALTLSDLKSLADELVLLFEVISFGNWYKYYLISYDPEVKHPAGSDSRPDIERILDAAAKESPTLRYPEENPETWAHRRARWSQNRLDQFNRFRRKFGLPEVP